jgi:hypothetical protein
MLVQDALAGSSRPVDGPVRATPRGRLRSSRDPANPRSAGKNWQKLDFGPFGDRTRAAKPLLFQKTKGQIP